MTTDSTLAGGYAARILIVDDHPLIREGLVARISRRPDMEICGEAASVEEALAKAAATDPDLITVDILLGESNGIDLIKQVKSRFPRIKMLVVSAYDELLYAERALRAGAHGYINKREMQESIILALREVLDGNRYVSPDMTQRLVGQAVSRGGGESDPIARLSDRELEVFRLIGEGETTRAIANRLRLSPNTIDTHREKIKLKLDLKTANQLQREATQWLLEKGN